MKHGFTDFGKTAYANGWIDLIHSDIQVALFDIKLNRFVSTKTSLTGKRVENGCWFADDIKVECTETSTHYVIQLFINNQGRDEVIANISCPFSLANEYIPNTIDPMIANADVELTWHKETGIASLDKLKG